MSTLAEAYKMLDTFAGVGATRFDVTFLDIYGANRGFRKGQSIMQLCNSLPKLLPGLGQRQNNLIVRPHSDTVTLVQLDDLNADAPAGLQNVAFLTLCTSPGNHQVWVAVSGAPDKDFARRLRKGTGADPSASGSTRLAGTVNYKLKYEPGFPTVSIVSAAPGRIVTPEQLESLGLVSEPVPAARAAPLRVSASPSGNWPDYHRCVQGAPLNHGRTGPDISRADYFFCLMAAQRGKSIEEIAARLMEESAKARENGEAYARLTAENATAAVARKPQVRAR